MAASSTTPNSNSLRQQTHFGRASQPTACPSWRTAPYPAATPCSGPGGLGGNQSRDGHLGLSAPSDAFFLGSGIGAERCLPCVPLGDGGRTDWEGNCGPPSLAKGWRAKDASSFSSFLLTALGESLSSWDKMGYTHQAPSKPCCLPTWGLASHCPPTHTARQPHTSAGSPPLTLGSGSGH